MSVNAQALRSVMRYWGTGVTIVTAQTDGERHGMTVSSFTSLSLEPALVLISLESSTRTCRLVHASRVFGVTILAAHQQALSDRFAGKGDAEPDRFQGLATRSLVTGSPLLTEGLAFLDCRVISSVEYGENTIFIGEVAAVESQEGWEPLFYYDRAYIKLQP
jgi:3-hydroxy-9,10-secoandrosta-1,3,5(10)-triene-9,17-dione monooxygenase reductase component